MYLGELHPGSGTGIVGLWHLNGNSNDSSGNANNGTDTSITYSLANGKFGQGAGFNGSTSKIILGSGINPANTFSLLLWLKPPDNNNRRTIFGGNNTGTTALDLAINRGGSGKIGFHDVYVWYTNGVAWDATFNIPAGNYGLLAVIYDSSTQKMRFIWMDSAQTLDSGEVSKTVVGAGTRSGLTLLGFGGVNSNNEGWYYGSMDEAAIFNKVITLAEIRKMYAVAKGRYL